MTKEYLSCADTAKLVRRALKEAFPEIKFSVVSSVYSGGASLRVRWTDGPIVAQVDPIVKPFAGGSFDGMTDSMSYTTAKMDGKEVHFGADFVFTARVVSDNRMATLTAQIERAPREHWLTIACEMKHPHPTQAVYHASSPRDFAWSLLSAIPVERFEGRKSAFAESVAA